jgi:hypothetical protein
MMCESLELVWKFIKLASTVQDIDCLGSTFNSLFGRLLDWQINVALQTIKIWPIEADKHS